MWVEACTGEVRVQTAQQRLLVLSYHSLHSVVLFQPAIPSYHPGLLIVTPAQRKLTGVDKIWDSRNGVKVFRFWGNNWNGKNVVSTICTSGLVLVIRWRPGSNSFVLALFFLFLKNLFEVFIIPRVHKPYYFFPLISFDKLLFQQTPKSASLYFYYNCLITFQYCNGYW